MSESPMSLVELGKRMERAANSELFAINIMECGAARVGAPYVLTDVVVETRRQAKALGLAHQIALKLQANPALALGLGLQDLLDLGEAAP